MHYKGKTSGPDNHVPSSIEAVAFRPPVLPPAFSSARCRRLPPPPAAAAWVVRPAVLIPPPTMAVSSPPAETSHSLQSHRGRCEAFTHFWLGTKDCKGWSARYQAAREHGRQRRTLQLHRDFIGLTEGEARYFRHCASSHIIHTALCLTHRCREGTETCDF